MFATGAAHTLLHSRVLPFLRQLMFRSRIQTACHPFRVSAPSLTAMSCFDCSGSRRPKLHLPALTEQRRPSVLIHWPSSPLTSSTLIIIIIIIIIMIIVIDNTSNNSLNILVLSITLIIVIIVIMLIISVRIIVIVTFLTLCHSDLSPARVQVTAFAVMDVAAQPP